MPAGTTVARRDLERLWIPTWSYAVDMRMTIRIDDDAETLLLSTADGTGLLPGVDLTDSAALLEVMDADGRR